MQELLHYIYRLLDIVQELLQYSYRLLDIVQELLHYIYRLLDIVQELLHYIYRLLQTHSKSKRLQTGRMLFVCLLVLLLSSLNLLRYFRGTE